MVVAAADLVAEHRDGRISTGALMRRAGVSTHEFYAAFETLESCLLAGFDEALARLTRSLASVIPREGTLVRKIEMGLFALLVFLEQEPGWGRLLLLELPIAARPQRQRAIARLAQTVSSVGAEASLDTGPPPSQARIYRVSGAVLGVIAENLASERPIAPEELGPRLMAALIGPAIAGPPAPGADCLCLRPGQPRRISAHTARSARVLRAVARAPGSSNREVARAAGVANDSNVSAHLRRLERKGLIRNITDELGRGKPNAWTLTSAGEAFVS